MIEKFVVHPSFVLIQLMSMAIMFVLPFTRFYWISLAYFLWIYLDRKTAQEGGRANDSFRSSFFWKFYAKFFPINLVKTADLDPSKNYLLGVHPHGIFPIGSIINFGTEATGFKHLFPNITPHLLTINVNYFQPIIRDILLLMGCSDVSKESIEYVLQNKGKCNKMGQAAAIIVGGVAEMRVTHPDHIKLKLKNRYGFIKMALKTGSDLVPVFTFGESEIYPVDVCKYATEVDSSTKMKREFGKNFFKPSFWTRIFYETYMNIMFGIKTIIVAWKRTPLNTVVGKPIEVKNKIENPTEDEVKSLHETYVRELENLFHQHKSKFITNKDVTLEIF